MTKAFYIPYKGHRRGKKGDSAIIAGIRNPGFIKMGELGVYCFTADICF